MVFEIIVKMAFLLRGLIIEFLTKINRINIC